MHATYTTDRRPGSVQVQLCQLIDRRVHPPAESALPRSYSTRSCRPYCKLPSRSSTDLCASREGRCQHSKCLKEILKAKLRAFKKLDHASSGVGHVGFSDFFGRMHQRPKKQKIQGRSLASASFRVRSMLPFPFLWKEAAMASVTACTPQLRSRGCK